MGPLERFSQSGTVIIQPITIERADGWRVTTNQQSVYVVASASGDTPRVLSAVCPHLGCTVQWDSEQDRFRCPCHGAEYGSDGVRLAGPANRGMDELPVSIRDGKLYVQYHSYRQLRPTKELLD